MVNMYDIALCHGGVSADTCLEVSKECWCSRTVRHGWDMIFGSVYSIEFVIKVILLNKVTESCTKIFAVLLLSNILVLLQLLHSSCSLCW